MLTPIRKEFDAKHPGIHNGALRVSQDAACPDRKDFRVGAKNFSAGIERPTRAAHTDSSQVLQLNHEGTKSIKIRTQAYGFRGEEGI